MKTKSPGLTLAFKADDRQNPDDKSVFVVGNSTEVQVCSSEKGQVKLKFQTPSGEFFRKLTAKSPVKYGQLEIRLISSSDINVRLSLIAPADVRIDRKAVVSRLAKSQLVDRA